MRDDGFDFVLKHRDVALLGFTWSGFERPHIVFRNREADAFLPIPFGSHPTDDEARVKGLGAFELTLAGADEKPCVAIGWTHDNGTQYDEHRAVKYAERVKLTKRGLKDRLPPQTLGGVPITVWDPSESIDQGRHRKTANVRDLVWDPMMEERTPWSVGFEYFQWRVPAKHWLYAWVLCADVPQTGKAPVLGTQLCRFGRGCTSGNIDFATTPPTDRRATR